MTPCSPVGYYQHLSIKQ